VGGNGCAPRYGCQHGCFMLLYVDLAYEQARFAGELRSFPDLRDAIRYGAQDGSGFMIGGICTSFLLELLLYPAVYGMWQLRLELNQQHMKLWTRPMLRDSSARCGSDQMPSSCSMRHCRITTSGDS
jgi:hypothetical protein